MDKFNPHVENQRLEFLNPSNKKKIFKKYFFPFFTKKKVLGFFPGFSRLKEAKKKFRYFSYLPWDFLCISKKIGKVKDFYYTFIVMYYKKMVKILHHVKEGCKIFYVEKK